MKKRINNKLFRKVTKFLRKENIPYTMNKKGTEAYPNVYITEGKGLKHIITKPRKYPVNKDYEIPVFSKSQYKKFINQYRRQRKVTGMSLKLQKNRIARIKKGEKTTTITRDFLKEFKPSDWEIQEAVDLSNYAERRGVLIKNMKSLSNKRHRREVLFKKMSAYLESKNIPYQSFSPAQDGSKYININYKGLPFKRLRFSDHPSKSSQYKSLQRQVRSHRQLRHYIKRFEKVLKFKQRDKIK